MLVETVVVETAMVVVMEGYRGLAWANIRNNLVLFEMLLLVETAMVFVLLVDVDFEIH